MMAVATLAAAGSVVSLWRYPVKSMMGEELDAADITERGLSGDRAYALVDASNGKVASAKNPRKWGRLLGFRAAFVGRLDASAAFPAVRITLPDGTPVTDDTDDIDRILSDVLGRRVTLESVVPEIPSFEEYWPDIDGLPYRNAITDEFMSAGMFFDGATVHVLTTATIDRLRELYPNGRFEILRFRPNIVVSPAPSEKDFIEDAWVGRTLAIGNDVRLHITRPCPRCVMTTLPQGNLPKDPGILRAAARHNQLNVGVYAAVLQGGTVHRGDPVVLE